MPAHADMDFNYINARTLQIKGEDVAPKRWVEEQIAGIVPCPCPPTPPEPPKPDCHAYMLPNSIILFSCKGSVPTFDDLGKIKCKTLGDAYQTEDTGKMYGWYGSGWLLLSFTVDMTKFYTKTEVDTMLDEIRQAIANIEEQIPDPEIVEETPTDTDTVG